MRAHLRAASAAAVAFAAAISLSACDPAVHNGADSATPHSMVTVTESAHPDTTNPDTAQPPPPQQADDTVPNTGAGDPATHATTSRRPAPRCSTESAAAIANATGRITRPLPTTNPDVPWVYGGATNYNTCNDLSYATLNTKGATASSPYQLLLFHRGQFVGTGVKCNLGYQTVTAASTTQVYVNYRYLNDGDISANPTGSVDVSFEWVGGQVVMHGTLPAAVTRGQC